MTKLIYGLAKFSNTKYGFGSRPKNFNKKKFLFKIKQNFNTFECADRYKNSTNYLKFLKKKQIHFKIDNIPVYENEKKIESFFLKKIEFYKKKINRDSINVLYLHQNSLNIISNKKILRVLKKIKKKNLVKNFGVSIYSQEELNFAIKQDIYNYIQIPTNLADSHYYFKYVKKINRKIFVGRSIVLQGALLNKNQKINFRQEISEYLKKIDTICKLNKISREELVYRFVFSLKKLNYVIIGSINYENINKIFKYKKKGELNKKILIQLYKLSKKKIWSNPKNWL